MLLAAGLGTRLKPFTSHHPKALATVNGKTLLQHNIDYLLKHGVTDIIVNVHHFAEQVIDALMVYKEFGKHITLSDESDELLETGGGLLKAAWFFDDGDPFILMNVDILTDMDMFSMAKAHIATDALATLAVTNRSTSRYFLFDKENILCGWRNTKTGEEKISRAADQYFSKAFSGIHIISPHIFPLISFTGKFSMVDVYLELAKDNAINAFDHTGSKFIDVGKPGSIGEAEKMFS